jgi:exodeoxyribonuclease VII large subunit
LLTSATGAVVHDMLNIIQRRFANVHIDIIPVKVQGHDAVSEIVSGIETMRRRGDSNVAVLARGGGSLEDMQAFNSEAVARAIFASEIPIISAVGHETDFTIADFVSDLRAPTPSAAAELVVPLKNDLIRRCHEVTSNLVHRMALHQERLRNHLADLSRRLIDPKKRLQDLRLKLDDVTLRLLRSMDLGISMKREKLKWRIDNLYSKNPINYINIMNLNVKDNSHKILVFINININNHRQNLQALLARLTALSPLGILERGYSITRTIPDGTVVRNADTVRTDQRLEIMLAQGRLSVRVTDRETEK